MPGRCGGGPGADVLERPLHPYTMGLTNAFPDLERAARQLAPIAGSPPDLRFAAAGLPVRRALPLRIAAAMPSHPR